MVSVALRLKSLPIPALELNVLYTACGALLRLLIFLDRRSQRECVTPAGDGSF